MRKMKENACNNKNQKKIEDCQIEQLEMHDKPEVGLAKPEGHAPRFLSLLK